MSRNFRCQWFEDDGTPRQNGKHFGCKRGPSCNFVHPSDPAWASLPKGRIPNGYPPYDDRGRSPRRYSTGSSRPMSRSPVPPPAHDRRRQDSSSSAGRYYDDYDKRYEARPRSMLDDRRREDGSHDYQREREKERERERDYYARDPDRRGDREPGEYRSPRRRSFSNSPDKGFRRRDRSPIPADRKDSFASTSSVQDRSFGRPPPPPPAAGSSRLSSMPAPPPPAVPAPLPPPPPLPQPFAAAAAAPVPELTEEEKRELWTTRIKIMAEYTKNRTELDAIEKDIHDVERIANSHQYTIANSTDDGKRILNTRLAALKKKLAAKQGDLGSCLTRLVETGFWPALKQPDVDAIGEQFSAMKDRLAELKATVAETREKLQHAITLRNEEIANTRSQWRPVAESSTSMAMDVDRSDNLAPPSKRRRLSVTGESSRPSQQDAPIARPEELKDVPERLEWLERRLNELENDLVQRDANLTDELEVRLDLKMDELSLRNRQNRAAKDKILHDPEKLKAVENNINVTGDQITELAEEVANLIGSTRSREDEYARMKQENEEMRQRHAELEKALQEFQEAHEKQRAEMNTISAALAAHLARPPSPPTSPISPEYILQAIEQPLTDSVHAHVQPLIDNLREQIGELLKARNAETYATLWNKLTMTLRVMETLSARVEKEQGALAPSNSNATR